MPRWSIALGLVLLVTGPLQADFTRGDANTDGAIDIADVVGILEVLFIPGTEPPECLDALDIDDGGILDIGDAIQLASYLFSFGGPPMPPFPDEGSDPTPDSLGDCGAGGGPGTPLPFDVLVSGGLSGIPDPCVTELLAIAIRTQDEWTAFWDQHVTIFPAPPAPVVDFTTDSLIALIQSAPSSGWAVTVESVVEFDDHVEVEVDVVDATGCIALPVCSAPHQIVIVPALTTDGDVTANATTELPCL